MHPETAGIDVAVPRPSLLLDHEPFPAVQAGSEVLRDREIVCLVDTGTLGKYRVEQRGTAQAGPAFLVTLYGATCSKIELLGNRKLDSPDYLAAIKHAVEREIGYWQNRGQPLQQGEGREIEVTVRDTDFTIPSSGN
ncbi:MAG TPA: hypothetical protein VIG29_16655 [Vicinamibacteria bacterium]|jgi:hypothetical protein